MESVSDAISVIEAQASMWLVDCAHYIDELVPYAPGPLELGSYWECG